MLRKLKHSFFALLVHLRRGDSGVVIVRAALAMALLVFCVGVQSQGISENKAVGQKNTSAKQPQAPAKVDTTSLEKAIRESIKEASEKPDTHATEKLDIDRQLRDYTGQLSTYTEKLSDYTRWLVVATVILGVIGVGQGYLTWRTVKVAESALTDLERPYIFLDLSQPIFDENVDARRSSSGDLAYDLSTNALQIRYWLYNGGRTPAILTHHRQDVLSTASGALPLPVDPTQMRAQDVLPAGTAVDRKRECSIKYKSDEMFGATHRPPIFLIGFVRHRDIFCRTHVTGFCARFDWSSNRFVLEGDERYNYMRDE